jgi:hypothetical protein
MTETPFQIKHHHRYDLRDWIKDNFPFVIHYHNRLASEQLKTLERRAQEIYTACITVRDIDRRAHSAYIDYYRRDWENIEQHVKDKNYTALAEDLTTLLAAIEVE